MEIQFPNLHINIEHLPKNFNVFGIDVAFYGCIIAIGMLNVQFYSVCVIFFIHFFLNATQCIKTFAIIFSVIGARLYYVVFSWDYYSKHPGEIINIRQGGLAIYGGVIAAIITCFVYTRIKKMSFKKVLDTAVLGLILGQIIGRWGNFFNREAFGGVAGDGNPWVMRIFFGDNYNISQVPDAVKEGMEKLKGMTLDQIGYIQVQPTFLYE